MGEQNKILDVTYGKFSCRLEGFDDAVETMKSVVSYFQDLAGHDNFLEVARGIPDLETLARMAEAQSGGTVTAAPMGAGVSLTRVTEDVTDEPTVPVAEEETPSDDDMSWADDMDHAADETADEVAQDDEADVAMADAQADDGDADDIFAAPKEAADDADEIADDETASWEATDEADLIEAAEEGDHADESETVWEDNAEAADVAEVEEAPETVEVAATDEALVAEDEIDAEEVYTTDTPETAAADQSDALEDEDDDSFASKLDRIRNVVSRGIVPPPVREEQQTAPTPLRAGNPLAQRLAELAKRNSELMENDDRAISPLERAPQDDEAAADAADEMATTEARDTDWPVETPEAAVIDVEEDDDLAEEFRAEVAEDVAEDVAADQWADEDDADEAPLVAETGVAEAAEVSEDDGHLDDDAEVADAAVEPEVAAADDAEDDAEDEARPVSTPSAARPLLLTTPQRPVSEDVSEDDDSDDFDLSAELAEIEKEIAARPRNEMTRHGLPRRVEDAMSRIFMQTNQQLDAPEGRRHRDALAQLKAAVAATEAAKQLGDNTRSRDAGETFRDDLGALATEGRSGSDGLPPLKLVKPSEDEDEAPVISEPRITSKPLDVAAERLREIAATKDARDDSRKSGGFAAFLEKQGVTDLADKLEAAAAYMAFVEGEPDFTRPQLMRLVQSASREEITREDGLRCFGRLLRQSRFAKLNNGRFKVDENTPFRPRDPRVAQG